VKWLLGVTLAIGLVFISLFVIAMIMMGRRNRDRYR
jgi:hypothetical protein